MAWRRWLAPPLGRMARVTCDSPMRTQRRTYGRQLNAWRQRRVPRWHGFNRVRKQVSVAHIFIGNASMVDDDVLEAVKTLHDEFWVFAEFDVHRRNIDWLIIRQVPDNRPEGRFSTVILTELKRTRAILDGDDNGRWRENREGIWQELEPSNMRDANPWRQLINTVNVFRDWLYNNQRRFLTEGDGQLYPESAVKVWPNLLILSDPPDLVHRLPL